VKIGAENKKEVRWMIALLAVLLLVGVSGYFEVDGYFNKHEPDAASYAEHSTPETMAAREANSFPDNFPDAPRS